MRRLHNLTYVFMLLLAGCGMSDEAKIYDAILSANIFLNSFECDKALEVLEGVSGADSNAKFLQTKASAYACKASFNEPTFFGTDLPKLGTPSFLGGASRFTTSRFMEEYNSEEYINLLTGINILLYAGGISDGVNPTAAKRAENFSEGDLGDIHTQLMYMLFAQLGMFVKFYGNADSDGYKGQGDDINGCFLDYDTLVENLLTSEGAEGTCNAAAAGHLSMGAEGDLNLTRLCQGVVILNNLIIIAAEVVSSVSGSDDFDVIDLAEFAMPSQATLEALPGIDATKASQIRALPTLTGQTKCETDYDTADGKELLELYYYFFYEKLFTSS